MSDKNLGQRINIRFCVKIGKNASETLALLTVAYGEYAMKKSSVLEWHTRFKEGRDVQDDPRSGQPKTQRKDANVDRVRTLVRSDRRLVVRVKAEEVNMNRETVRQIVKEDLGVGKISAKMVPRILTHNQKQCRLHISSDLLRNAKTFDRAITGDETLRFQYDPETKRQSMQWKTRNSPRPKNARMSRSQVKTMLMCFFEYKGIVHYEFTAQGQMVNQQCYLEVLTRLRESVRRKRPGLWPDKWILHHDNAPAHDALRVREFLAKNSITKMDHPPYSPDLAPCDFRFFPKLKNALKAQTFADLLTSNAT